MTDTIETITMQHAQMMWDEREYALYDIIQKELYKMLKDGTQLTLDQLQFMVFDTNKSFTCWAKLDRVPF